ncbi:MAG: patatin-like phospholipase family protein [Candidatus Berkiellales bacterium]
MPPAQKDNAIDDYLQNKMGAIKARFGIEDFGKITFKQLKELSKEYPQLGIKNLYLTATKVSDASLKILSADREPEMPVSKAVRMTMCYAGGFAPVKHEGEYYVDGGIANNYPMEIFDEEQFLTHGINDAKVNPCTLGLLMDSKLEIESRWGIPQEGAESPSLPEFVGLLLKAMHNRSEILRDKYNVNSIQISDNVSEDEQYRGAPMGSFDLTEQEKARLKQNGRDAIDFYYNNYCTAEVGYYHLPPYQNLYQKYLNKSALQLKYIFMNEVLPLLEQYEKIKPHLDNLAMDVKSQKNRQLVAKVKEAYEILLEEKKMIHKALKAKGVSDENLPAGLIEMPKVLMHEHPIARTSSLKEVRKSTPKPELIARVETLPKVETLPTEITEVPQQIPQKLAPKIPQSFADIFKDVFPEEKWKSTHREETLHYQNKKHLDHKMNIHRSATNVAFSGIPVKKISQAANAYKNSLPPTQTMIFEIKAMDRELAIDFLNKLEASGFDISQIKKIQYENNRIEEHLEQLVQNIKGTRLSPPLAGG